MQGADQVSSAQARVAMLEDGILQVAMCGVLTGDGLERAIRHVIHRLTAAPVGVLVDYRRAVLALSASELDRAVLSAQHNSPTALLAGAADVELLRHHCARMAMQGMTRRVFIDRREAALWVHDRARGTRPAH